MKWAAALAVVSGVLASSAAQAGDSVAAAQAAFQEGRKLEDARDFAGAIARFEESERLDPALGTTLNVAACYEQAGRLASAWRAFLRGAQEASAIGEDKRARRAHELADALAPRLSSLAVTVQGEPFADEEVRIDDAAIERSAWGTSRPIDGGHHRIVVRAAGHREFSTELDVAAEGARAVVTVPGLDLLPVTAEASPPLASTAPLQAPPAPPPPASDRGFWTPVRIAGAATAGAGVAGLAIGIGFGIQTRNLWLDREAQCVQNLCTDAGYALSSSAHDAAMRANVAFAVGGAAVAVGGVLLLLPPRWTGNDVQYALYRPRPSGSPREPPSWGL
jgi:hypothetical protein